MPIYIYKGNSQISTNPIRNTKVVKAMYAKEQGKDIVCVWGIDRSIPYDKMFTYTVSNDKITITGLKPEVKTSSIIIPDTISNKQVSFIANSAFENNSKIVTITIPDSVTSIGLWAFDGCTGLTSVTIGNSVTNIGTGAFSGCTGLTSVTIPDSVTYIGDSVFYSCTSLTSINFNGTTAQWDAVSTGSNLVKNAGTSQVNCTDGIVQIWK